MIDPNKDKWKYEGSMISGCMEHSEQALPNALLPTNDTEALLKRLRRNNDGVLCEDAADTIEALSSALAAAERERDAMAEALWLAEPAWSNLTDHQEQADMHGEMVKVSRQALEETLAAIRAALPAKQEPSQ